MSQVKSNVFLNNYFIISIFESAFYKLKNKQKSIHCTYYSKNFDNIVHYSTLHKLRIKIIARQRDIMERRYCISSIYCVFTLPIDQYWVIFMVSLSELLMNLLRTVCICANKNGLYELRKSHKLWFEEPEKRYFASIFRQLRNVYLSILHFILVLEVLKIVDEDLKVEYLLLLLHKLVGQEVMETLKRIITKEISHSLLLTDN